MWSTLLPDISHAEAGTFKTPKDINDRDCSFNSQLSVPDYFHALELLLQP